jgi:hypothetical protein
MTDDREFIFASTLILDGLERLLSQS